MFITDRRRKYVRCVKCVDFIFQIYDKQKKLLKISLFIKSSKYM